MGVPEPDGGRPARLFTAAHGAVGGSTVLYPGSFVDVAASLVWPSVVYNDADQRAARFFDDRNGGAEILAQHGVEPTERDITFVAGDYASDLGLDDESVDLLISLYTGFISEHCTRHLRIGGFLLVNSSHGDAAMASIDERYRFHGAVIARSGGYRVATTGLDRFLVLKRTVEITRESLDASGRGVAYTTPAFAYLFERIR